MKKIIFIFIFSLSNILHCQIYSDFGKEVSNNKTYSLHDVNFMNSEDNIKLYGTLIIPKKAYTKVVIIVPGSGPDSRNSHYVLAEELLNNGVAVYRYDERGIGQSEGKYKFKEDNTDLFYALENLKKIDTISKKKIGIIGHSMGGYLAINTYLQRKDLDFLLLISTPIERDGKFKNLKFKNNNNEKYTLENIFKNIETPTMYLAGNEDSFSDTYKTIVLLQEIKNKKIELKLMKGLNHFLKIGNDDWRKTGDYKLLYEIDKNALNEIINWINKI